MTASAEAKVTWHGQAASIVKGSIPEIMKHVPFFEQMPFAMGEAANDYYDMIVSRSHPDGPVPVAVVSSKYQLVQHQDILEVIAGALKKVEVDPRQVQADLCLSAYGEKMRFRAIIPDNRFAFDPGDGCPVGLRLTCFNSVDRSSALEFHTEWYRLVCSNGLLEEGGDSFRRVHIWPLTIGDVAAYLEEYFELFDREGDKLAGMLEQQVSVDDLYSWVNTEVTAAWGSYQAARVLHICLTGFDAFVRPGQHRMKPWQYEMKVLQVVPGAPEYAGNAYHICQALTWVAQQSRTVQGEWDKTKNVSQLMAKLVAAA